MAGSPRDDVADSAPGGTGDHRRGDAMTDFSAAGDGGAEAEGVDARTGGSSVFGFGSGSASRFRSRSRSLVGGG